MMVKLIRAAALPSPVKSGDFLVVTELTGYYGDALGAFRLLVLSPKGSLRASFVLSRITPKPKGCPDSKPCSPCSDSNYCRLSVIHQTAISPDGKFAFTTESYASGLKQRIHAIRLGGSSPKVIRTVPITTSKRCAWIDAGKIAVDGPSRNGSYGMYISRNCYDGCDFKSTGKISSFEVVKLRYNPSTGKLTQDAKKPYISSRFPCGKEESGKYFFQFTALKVIEGELYGLMSDNVEGLKLMKVGSPNTLAGSSSGYGKCDVKSFTIASSNQIQGICDYGIYRNIPVFVRGSKFTKSSPLQLTYKRYIGIAGEPNTRFIWQGSVASQPLLRTSCAFLQDRGSLGNFTVGGNFTLYKFDQENLGKLPVATATIDMALLPTPVVDGESLTEFSEPFTGYNRLEIQQLLPIP